jgi:thiamine pyrophosphate-dependent acetolactate synthase large subunit-like protein
MMPADWVKLGAVAIIIVGLVGIVLLELLERGAGWPEERWIEADMDAQERAIDEALADQRRIAEINRQARTYDMIVDEEYNIVWDWNELETWFGEALNEEQDGSGYQRGAGDDEVS